MNILESQKKENLNYKLNLNKINYTYLKDKFEKYKFSNLYFFIEGDRFSVQDLSILNNFKKENLKLEPFPHLIIENALNSQIYDYLDENYPDDFTILEIIGKDSYGQNCRYDLPTKDLIDSPKIDPIWKIFSFYHSTKNYISDLRSKFGKKLFDNMDHFEYKKLKFDNLKVGIRFKDSNGQKKDNKRIPFDIETECQIGINTPCNVDSYVKGPHIDHFDEVYAGLFYLKRKNDLGKGGNLEIYKTKDNIPSKDFTKKIKLLPDEKTKINGLDYVRKREFDTNLIEKVGEVTYGKNKFICFLNKINAIHGVSIRQSNQLSRRLVNIIGESFYPSEIEAYNSRAPEWKSNIKIKKKKNDHLKFKNSDNLENKDFLFVTSFNQKLYDIYAKNFINTYNLPFDLKVYSEDELYFDTQLKNLEIFNIFTEMDDFKKFVEKNKNEDSNLENVNELKKFLIEQAATEDFLKNTIRFSYKVFSLIDAFNKNRKKYKYLVWIDADCIFTRKFDYKFLSLLINKKKFMSYLGREGSYSECGFLIFNIRHKLSSLYFARMKEIYLSEKVFSLPETHDSFVWDYIRNEFEKKYENFRNINITEVSYRLLKIKKKSKKQFISNEYGTHVLLRSILYLVINHLKGGRKLGTKNVEGKLDEFEKSFNIEGYLD